MFETIILSNDYAIWVRKRKEIMKSLENMNSDKKSIQ